MLGLDMDRVPSSIPLMPRVPEAVLMYAPEQWGEVERFKRFFQESYSFPELERRAVVGVSAQFLDAIRLLSLARKLLPNLDIDEAEMEAQGFTPAANAAELTAVFEAAIRCLYSSVDCCAKVFRAVYGPQARGFKTGTRFLFQSFEKIDGLPVELKNALREADWYRPLMHLRDELTHYSTGHCSKDRETGTVRYMHTAVKGGANGLIIDDAIGWADALARSIDGFLGATFHVLNQGLSDRRVFQMCGMTQGRVLHRYVSVKEAVDFHGGSCGSHHWFDLPEHPTCPFAPTCGAYSRKSPIVVGQ